jgi:hypothetical protein
MKPITLKKFFFIPFAPIATFLHTAHQGDNVNLKHIRRLQSLSHVFAD